MTWLHISYSCPQKNIISNLKKIIFRYEHFFNKFPLSEQRRIGEICADEEHEDEDARCSVELLDEAIEIDLKKLLGTIAVCFRYTELQEIITNASRLKESLTLTLPNIRILEFSIPTLGYF